MDRQLAANLDRTTAVPAASYQPLQAPAPTDRPAISRPGWLKFGGQRVEIVAAWIVAIALLALLFVYLTPPSRPAGPVIRQPDAPRLRAMVPPTEIWPAGLTASPSERQALRGRS